MRMLSCALIALCACQAPKTPAEPQSAPVATSTTTKPPSQPRRDPKSWVGTPGPRWLDDAVLETVGDGDGGDACATAIRRSNDSMQESLQILFAELAAQQVKMPRSPDGEDVELPSVDYTLTEKTPDGKCWALSRFDLVRALNISLGAVSVPEKERLDFLAKLVVVFQDVRKKQATH
ncbi:MAG: hypothetical protein HY791_26715 [Deltaproteobacteria bacterium]|nr:hypothetical protein [Deltaproteobacteria bacterium]